MISGTDPVVSLRDLLAKTLAERRHASTRYRRLSVALTERGDAAAARVFTQLAIAEFEFVARIERDLPDLDVGAILAERVTWTEAMQQSMLDESISPLDALEAARRNERGMRAVFEHLAATSPDQSVRMRALECALAETRHLSSIEKLVTPLSGAAPLYAAGTGHAHATGASMGGTSIDGR